MWIEISINIPGMPAGMCRPPHGGCGLKSKEGFFDTVKQKSPSPRRVWIEIVFAEGYDETVLVALPTEGVD